MKAITKHYVGSETVTLKAFHDEWEVAEPREEVQHLADKINDLQAQLDAVANDRLSDRLNFADGYLFNKPIAE